MKPKIDFVIPWVDGSDKAWQEERFDYLGNESQNNYIESQYRDWDMLKYWFRSVEKFAPWVNKIYFVTWGHIPDFLDINHPKLVIVKHEDYIPKQYLPTFSSHTIETNFHRINDLTEHFVYFNDDVFITQPLTEKDFFKNGLPKDTAIIKPIIPARYETISNLMINNTGIINSHFNKRKVIKSNLSKWFNPKYGLLNLLNLNAIPWDKFSGFYEQHTANAFLKTTFIEVWEKETDILIATSKNKVRNFKLDVNQWLFKNWRIAKGEFIPRSHKFGKYVMVDSKAKAKEAACHLKNQTHKTICINDHYIGEELSNIIEIIQGGFNSVLSKKSTFEK